MSHASRDKEFISLKFSTLQLKMTKGGLTIKDFMPFMKFINIKTPQEILLILGQNSFKYTETFYLGNKIYFCLPTKIEKLIIFKCSSSYSPKFHFK